MSYTGLFFGSRHRYCEIGGLGWGIGNNEMKGNGVSGLGIR